MIGNEEFNPGSSSQLQDLLYRKFGIRERRNRKTGSPTADRKALLEIITTAPDDVGMILGKVLNYRDASKLLGTFLSQKLRPDGTMTTSYNISGTVNGRISSSTNLWDEGGNVQQVPRGPFRRIFIPRPGMVLVKVDLSQAEARVVAWTARIQLLIDLFSNDPSFDIHTWNAGENLFRVERSKVTKAMRQISKAGVHGGNYGLGAKTAALTYSVPYQQAKDAITRYRQALPDIEKWWRRVESEISLNRMLRTPFGRIRVFLDRLDHATFRSAYAFVPQSTVGDVINSVFGKAEEKLDGKGWPLIQVHDEIVFEIFEDHLQDGLETIRSLFQIPLHFPEVDVPLIIPPDISVGKNWFDQEKIKFDRRETQT